MKIGYARVSTIEQNLSEQMEVITAAGCSKIFSGKQSGVSKVNEDKLNELIDYIREGDTIIVTRLDRLGRSLKSILSAIERIHSKGANLKTLDGVVDTSVDSPFAKAVINLISTFAQLERDLIYTRTSEGRAKAKADGKHMGRPKKIDEKTREKIRASKAGVVELARKYNVTHTTIRRIKSEGENGVDWHPNRSTHLRRIGST